MKKTTEKTTVNKTERAAAKKLLTELLLKAYAAGKTEKNQIVKAIKRALNELNNNNYTVRFSNGNKKIGNMPAFNTAACLTCNRRAECYKRFCYAKAIDRVRPYVYINEIMNTYCFLIDPDGFINQFNAFLNKKRKNKITAFRLNAAGDIISYDYFIKLVEVIRSHPDITFLQYTKNYKIVNDYMKKYGVLPDNLIMQFSADNNLKMNNPYNFRVVSVFTPGCAPAVNKSGFICPCNRAKKDWHCIDCYRSGCGCFSRTTKNLYLQLH